MPLALPTKAHLVTPSLKWIQNENLIYLYNYRLKLCNCTNTETTIYRLATGFTGACANLFNALRYALAEASTISVDTPLPDTVTPSACN